MRLVGNLDDALARAGDLHRELMALPVTELADEQLPLIAQSQDLSAVIIERIEQAIAIDDELHPDDR